MTHQAILTASLFLLLAFVVERLGRRSGIPSVVVLIGTGLMAKPVLGYWGLELRGLDDAVPVVGTIGLVLIVLEGAFDLELRKERWRTVVLATLSATLCFAAWTVGFTLLSVLWLRLDLFHGILLAVPFSVISSAVAIPSSNFLQGRSAEFVVYESSISDILGILVFFALLNSDGSALGVLSKLLVGGTFSLVVGAVCAVILLVLLIRLEGHIRFIPLLAGLFALYAGGKMLNLSALIMVLMFGLVLNNPGVLARFRYLNRVTTDPEYHSTVKEFKTLTVELTFAVRSFFFVLLGYWADLTGLVSYDAWFVATLSLAIIYFVRYPVLQMLRIQQAEALNWIAPRGLITVLLYLNAKEKVPVEPYMDSVIMLVVLVSALAIGLGRARHRHKAE